MKKVRRYVKVLFLIIPFFVLFLLRPASGEKTGGPNIVLIVIDDLRYDHLPFYGYEKNTAPFLKKIASRSVVFDNAFAASSWTAPSTASILTSLYPFQHGVVQGLVATIKSHKTDPKIKLNRIPEKIKTIPEILRENSFRTYGVSQNINIGRKMGFAQGFEMFKRFQCAKKCEKDINDQLIKWAEKIKTEGKYFLYIHYMDPHQPFHMRDPWYQKKEYKRADAISRYDSEINYVDSMIEEMFKLFEWNSNTMLIVTADHGEEFRDHGLMGHGRTLYSEVIKIPLFIYFPEKDRMHKRININVSSIDILPTIRSYLKIEKRELEEGVNLIPLIQKDEEALKSRYLFSYLNRKVNKKKFKREFTVRATIYKNWKYISVNNARRELYNLKTDPEESINLINEYPVISDDMASKFSAFEEHCKKYKRESVNIKLNKKRLDELKIQGYW
jgi:arylsulfatase A-like enzyme